MSDKTFSFSENIEGVDLTKLPVKVVVSIVFFLIFLVLIIVIGIYALSDKSDSVFVNIAVQSEHFTYSPTSGLAPEITLKKFTPSFDCLEYEKNEYLDSTIILEKPTSVKITRLYKDEIKISILGKGKFGELELNDGPPKDLVNCFSVKINLTENFPVFSMNLHGKTSLGKLITDASGKFPPLLNSGQITLSDNTLVSGEQYSLSPRELQRGDHIYAEGDKVSMSGLIRANFDEPGMEGLFSVTNGTVFIQRYRTKPQEVSFGFINRIINDFELGFVLMVLIVGVKFWGSVINFLLRVKLIQKQTDLVNDDDNNKNKIS